MKAGGKRSQALDMALDVMRKTLHTELKKSAFESPYGFEPNTEISNMLDLDKLEKITKNSISAEQGTLQVYSVN